MASVPSMTTITVLATAASAHVPSQELAKTVMVVIDGTLAMAVLPASEHLDLETLKAAVDAQDVRLASEAEFESQFLDCDIGAMPPFGNLYGVDVYVSERLAEDGEIAFNAGNHRELVMMSYADFERLVGHQTLTMTSATPS